MGSDGDWGDRLMKALLHHHLPNGLSTQGFHHQDIGGCNISSRLNIEELYEIVPNFEGIDIPAGIMY